MGRWLVVGVAGCWLACAAGTDRRAQIAAGERIIARLAVDSEDAPELRFQLGSLRLEEADALDAADAGAGRGERMREQALAELTFVLERFPAYARRTEVLFWRAEALSALHRWAEAVVAWKEVPPQASENSVLYGRWRLAQALRETSQCEEALTLLDGADPRATRERCLCLKALSRECADSPK